MTDRPTPRRLPGWGAVRSAWRPGAGWFLLTLLALGAGVLVDRRATADQLALANPDQSRVSEVRSFLAGLPRRPLVLVGMDADLGTYPEIRGTVRAALTDLLERDARIAMVSFSPEGRAVAAAEMEALLASGVPPDEILDLGFVAGAEAGLVLAVTDLVPAGAEGSTAEAVREAGDGIAAFDGILVVGGIDFGPRSWVEQVVTRVPDIPVMAVAPTFALPELTPYLRSGQLDALLANVRDGAAYAAHVAESLPLDRAQAVSPGPAPLAMLLGMLIGLAFIVRSLAQGRGLPSLPAAGLEDGE